MPIVDGKYVNPGWVDGGPPALDAAELNAMSNTVASSQVQNNHTHTADKITPSAATSQKYFPSGDHTVDEVLSMLGKSLLLSGTSIKGPLGNLIKLPSAQLDSRVQIATGSYTGTGTSGSNNPTRIALPSFTKIVLIFGGNSYGYAIYGIVNMTLYSNLNANEDMFATFARYREDAIYKGLDGSATLLSVYSNEGVSGQFNISGDKYEWIAIG